QKSALGEAIGRRGDRRVRHSEETGNVGGPTSRMISYVEKCLLVELVERGFRAKRVQQLVPARERFECSAEAGKLVVGRRRHNVRIPRRGCGWPDDFTSFAYVSYAAARSGGQWLGRHDVQGTRLPGGRRQPCRRGRR